MRCLHKHNNDTLAHIPSNMTYKHRVREYVVPVYWMLEHDRGRTRLRMCSWDGTMVPFDHVICHPQSINKKTHQSQPLCDVWSDLRRVVRLYNVLIIARRAFAAITLAVPPVVPDTFRRSFSPELPVFLEFRVLGFSFEPCRYQDDTDQPPRRTEENPHSLAQCSSAKTCLGSD